MKRILIDMDDVMAETGLKILETYNNLFKTKFEKSDFDKNSFADIFKADNYLEVRKEISKPGFFRNLAVKENASEVIEKLYKEHDVYIVSAATEFPSSLDEKVYWLNEHFPYVEWQKMVFCGYKHMIKADVMIDDHTKNLDYFEGETKLLFNAMHNQQVKKYTRVSLWDEIAEILL
ncbi:MAG: 5'-3'-deoxyribonucleotidase, partial [Spirosomataceae bacterium]